MGKRRSGKQSLMMGERRSPAPTFFGYKVSLARYPSKTRTRPEEGFVGKQCPAEEVIPRATARGGSNPQGRCASG
jgi:hypothetical protein